MRKALLGVFLVSSLAFCTSGFTQQNVRNEMGEHPRIARAVRALEDAVQYLERAPHDFGGHKARAIADSRKAIEQLREAISTEPLKTTEGARSSLAGRKTGRET
jgi:hypothetical protein